MASSTSTEADRIMKKTRRTSKPKMEFDRQDLINIFSLCALTSEPEGGMRIVTQRTFQRRRLETLRDRS